MFFTKSNRKERRPSRNSYRDIRILSQRAERMSSRHTSSVVTTTTVNTPHPVESPSPSHIASIPRQPIKRPSVMKPTIFIQTTKYVYNYASGLARILTGLGHKVKVIDALFLDSRFSNNDEESSDMYIFMFIWHLRSLPKKGRYWIYNLEQACRYPNFPSLGLSQEIDSVVQTAFKSCSGILDYCEENLAAYPEDMQVSVSHITIPLNNYFPRTQIAKTKNVLFFGMMTERRSRILRHIKYVGGIDVTVVTSPHGAYGRDIYDLIRSAKVILNIHATATSNLEIGRLNDCITAGDTTVISETGTNTPQELLSRYERMTYFLPTIDDALHNIDIFITTISGALKEPRRISVDTIRAIENEINEVSTADIACVFLPPLEKEFPDITKMSHKEKFRANCYEDLPRLRNINVGEFSEGSDLETVLIEFRILPHVEYILRKAVITLPKTWSHTVVCGPENALHIQALCRHITRGLKSRIRVIVMEEHVSSVHEYNDMLLTESFWKMFYGEKLLIHQEDSLVFHGDIEQFLDWDYIGAPWPKGQDDNKNGVGNGGFSLRSKDKMLSCLRYLAPDKLTLGKSTKGYMDATGLRNPPEDVFFSKCLIDFGLGRVADSVAASRFSQETLVGSNPLGGHNFWLAREDDLWRRRMPQLILDSDYYIHADHRSGWSALMRNCLEQGVVTLKPSVQTPSRNDVILVDSMEQIWAPWAISSRAKPRVISQPWIGIIHYTDSLPPFIRGQHASDVLKNAILSLQNCKAIVTLSKYSEKMVKNFLNELPVAVKFLYPHIRDIPVVSLKHPIEHLPKRFREEEFFKPKERFIVQLGFQYRKITTIYKIDSKLQKVWLPGHHPQKAYRAMTDEWQAMRYTGKPNDVEIVRTDTNEEFDDIILNNFVIIPLWNASANNSVLECIDMCIPAFITRVEATEEYLGKDYPLFFTDIAQVERILRQDQHALKETLMEAHRYLVALDKSEIRYRHFNSELLKVTLR